nr:immunoglobulin heavy chain junction region [Mus musculus]
CARRDYFGSSPHWYVDVW